MNSRKRQLVQMILDGRTQFKIKDFEDMFDVGERTIRYDVENISCWLKEFDVLLEHQSGRGLWHLKEYPDSEKIKQIYDSLNFFGRSISIKDRLLLIVHELIINQSWQPLRQLAEELDVSKGTVLQQMEDVESWLKPFHLKLDRGRKGFKVNGKERNKRFALLTVMAKLENSWDTINPIPQLNWSHLSMKDMDQIFKTSTALMEAKETVPSFFRVWALHLERYRSGKFLTKTNFREVEPETWFYELWKELTSSFDIPMLEEEVEFAYIYLKAIGGIPHDDKDNYNKDLTYKTFIKEVVNRIGLKGLNESQMNDMYREWSQFQWASKYNTVFLHPLKEDIEGQYPFIVSHIWETLLDHQMNTRNLLMDDVISMSISMATIYEESSFENQRYQVWVLCPRGIATSRLLTSTLKKHFPQIEVKKTLSISELNQQDDWGKPDFIISSVSLHDSPYPYVTVKPVITKEELKKIKSFMTNLEDQQSFEVKNGTDPSIHALIPKERMTKYEEEPFRLEGVIDLGVALLENEGFVSSGFKEDMKRTVFSDKYIYEVVPGLLFLHTDSENVLKPGFSLVQLNKPYIVEGKLHSVAVLFMATPDKKAHLPQLQYLHQVLMNEDPLKDILN
ncbi:BglG family transcription antiterminator [Salipaludibacillus daqingensis]|uniref:BglG family transcription antiterminator n=1 Tax=Salipaludibacillus daqingensis TaxID=3041001 RepID=UPI0024760FC6|nr:helix-turn-helix domain-containing protein [Salipaludibacillus daqingensis]